ncbi:extracellular solute-binding protein [Virgibacillus dakarensis]|uniref:Spermidine/putrescine ABC transporter substrate-binding protein n=1 Tax=Lentibacillus populi TaxID=1827502 RepID=A0A9W5X552_9BACI|nr:MULTISPECIES: spermidine/putrescine ABC transporter substrate-binding protein [Bacillaceae]MBT2214573.1 spermidine/putrescine ABC transporter substrate-binding protein [Virgibacillus dakarensis]MTW87532.1 extracellular solute-binding protein [Virgibacillus dakarensis]GGB40760.1 spermidine/putrescine ABC transporter substrate-binding protein [Lentibacillus populi]
MKKFIWLITFGVLLIGLSACGSADDATADSGDEELADELYFFNWGGYGDEAIIKDFEEKYGVKVIYDTFSSNQEMLTKLNKANVPYDIVVPTDYIVERMIKQGLLAELDMDNIPNFKNIEEKFQKPEYDPGTDGKKYSVPYMYGTEGIAYNETKVEKPTSYEDLWNPKYKGHVTIQNDSRESLTMALQKLGYDANKPNEKNLKEAKQALIDLNPNILKYSSEPDADLVNGTAWISHTYNDSAARAYKENPNIKFVMPEEGGTIWVDNLVIPKTSKQKYTAEVFINFVLSAKVSAKLSENTPSSNPNEAAKELMSGELKNNPNSYPSIPESAVYYKDLKPEQLQMMNRTWQEVRAK